MESLSAQTRALLAGALFVVDVFASLHVVLRKRDVRAAIGWVGLIWLVPGVGALLYLLLGINRVRRRAIELHRERRRIVSDTAEHVAPVHQLGSSNPHLEGLARLGERVSARPLLGGNEITPLSNGDQAYPAMLAAIEQAQRTVVLCTYIFGNDRAGTKFAEALAAATRRGVQVRVLIDAVGVRYTWPPMHRVLQKAGVRAALFLPTIAQAGLAFFNLRNHRKLLIVDGEVAFTGGMNIQERNLVSQLPKYPVRDIHFRVTGPLLRQMHDAFAEDWAFTTGEVLDGSDWYPSVQNRGTVSARVITDGPDGNLEVMRSLLLGALTTARESVRIVTPYFLPENAMVAALAVAALRGVRVDILLPSQVNIRLAQWASTALLWQVLRPGCNVFLSPPPFDHSKMMVVDRAWALIGSSNWDARSLRLNFELDVECHDSTMAAQLDDLVQERIAVSRAFTLAEADARPLPIRLRDGVARLLTPYL